MKTIAIYLWQDMTMLDVQGPQQFLAYVPEFEVFTVAKSKEPIVSDTKMRVLPDHDFTTCPPVDIVLVGGGVDPSPEMQDDEVMDWFRKTGEAAEYVTSVCTGSLILAEAGLLEGYKATTHWAYKELLASYPGVEVAPGRVVTDRNRITGGGVTAGIDFGLSLITQVVGAEAAAGMQLVMEYDPQPPGPYGNPDTAPAEMVAIARAQTREFGPKLYEYYANKNA
jgi:cyclohexyl-isocyanide hydratase